MTSKDKSLLQSIEDLSNAFDIKLLIKNGLVEKYEPTKEELEKRKQKDIDYSKYERWEYANSK